MCTNLSIPRKAENDPLISARTMDWAVWRMETVANFVPRGQSFPESNLPGEIEWKNKYGFVGMGYPAENFPGLIYSDGMNETGLPAASLWLSCSQYQAPEPGKGVLYNTNFVAYVLGNFKDIGEVQAALPNLTVCEAPPPKESIRPTVHYIISDAGGDHLIIEFIEGGVRTYTNQTGILTNDPSYDWHLTNRMYYENLSLETNPKLWNGEMLYGSGQLGSPGDPTAASRFIRASLLTQSVFQPQNIQQSISLAQTILQTIAVPHGTVLLGSKENYDWTQWSMIRDHTNRSLYFYTDFNSKLYGIHLSQLDFAAGEQKPIEIDRPDWYEDISKAFGRD
jgi:choloylglycine hydrolase